MKFFTDGTGVIIDIAEDITIKGPFIIVRRNGKAYSYMHKGEVIYNKENLLMQNIHPQTHCYDTMLEEFLPNPDYKNPLLTVKTTSSSKVDSPIPVSKSLSDRIRDLFRG